jgi:hypothetical protein
MAPEPTTPQSTSKFSLGELVADYRPPRRRDLALKLIVVGVIAAIAWWGVVRFDGKLWILIPFLVALPSTLYCMQLIFRWLSPGDRVAIHDGGLVIGNNRIEWNLITRVTYTLDLGSTDDPVDSRTHKFHFYKNDGSETSLLLDDLDVPTHVDIDRLLQSLRDAPLELEIAHEPKLRTDADEMSRSQRNPILATQLQTALSALLAEKRLADGMMSYFAAALRDGHGVRGRNARKARWKSVGYGLLVLPGILLLVVAVITGFLALLTTVLGGVQGLSGLVGITLDIIDTKDFPIEFMTFAIAVALMLGAAAIASWLTPFVERCYKKAQYHDSLATGLYQRDVRQITARFLNHIERHEPFALYLRSFAAEAFHYEETSPLGGSAYTIQTKRAPVAREFDESMLASFSDSLPVYGLANANDSSASTGLSLLFVSDATWLKTMVELVCEAQLVIVHLYAITESLLVELSAIEQLGLQPHTVLLCSDGFPEHELDAAEAAILKTFPAPILVDKDGWQEQVHLRLGGIEELAGNAVGIDKLTNNIT